MNPRAFKLAHVFLIAALAALSLAGAEQPFSVTIEAPDKPLKVGAEVRLQVTVKNISNHDIVFLRSVRYGVSPEDGLRYKIHVLDSKANPASPSARVLELRKAEKEGKPLERFFEDHGRTLKPGESFVDEINVTNGYDLSRPGIYTLWVTRPMPPKLVPHGVEWPPGSVRSNTIAVTVVK